MSIIVNIDVMLALRKMSSGELAEKVGISATNLSILKTGKAKAIRFSTLDAFAVLWIVSRVIFLNTRRTERVSGIALAYLEAGYFF